MFLKSLTVTRGDGALIQDIRFRVGLNLIVDETPVVSGNPVAFVKTARLGVPRFGVTKAGELFKTT